MFGDVVEIDTRLATQGPPVWRREFVFKRAGATLATGFVDCFEDANADGDGDDDDDDDEQQAREPDFDLNSEPAREEQPAWDGPVPEPPAAPGRAFKGVWHVAWQHLDISGQVDPAVLTTMVGDMESRATESLGWTPRREYENGLIWQVSEHRLELFDTIEDEDALHIVSYIGEVDKDEMVRHTSIWRAESGVLNEVARARTRRVCTAPETGERRSIDDDWLYDLDDQLAEW